MSKNKILIECGSPVCDINFRWTKEEKPIFNIEMEKIKKLYNLSEIEFRIKINPNNNYVVVSGEYSINIFEEKNYLGKIPNELINILKTGSKLKLLEKDIKYHSVKNIIDEYKKNNVFDIFNEYITEYNIEKNIIVIDKNKQAEYNNCVNEVSMIIVNKLKELLNEKSENTPNFA